MIRKKSSVPIATLVAMLLVGHDTASGAMPLGRLYKTKSVCKPSKSAQGVFGYNQNGYQPVNTSRIAAYEDGEGGLRICRVGTRERMVLSRKYGLDRESDDFVAIAISGSRFVWSRTNKAANAPLAIRIFNWKTRKLSAKIDPSAAGATIDPAGGMSLLINRRGSIAWLTYGFVGSTQVSNVSARSFTGDLRLLGGPYGLERIESISQFQPVAGDPSRVQWNYTDGGPVQTLTGEID